jgi:hypothetical protein
MMIDSKTRFFTFGTANYFPGVVALINSLRLLGHGEEVVVLDEGCTPRQQERLRRHCTLVTRPHAQTASPALLKPWIGRGWFWVRRNAYNRLLSRVLLGPDVEILLQPDDLPIWLRRGMAGELALRALDIANAPITVKLRSQLFRLAARLVPARYARSRS